MSALPSGTVTFLFTDVQDSTRLWEQYPEEMETALEKHDLFLLRAIEECNGSVVKPTGDGFHAVFETAQDALTAALAAQQALHEKDWGDALVRVRMGIHTGKAQERAGDYFGTETNRAARLMSAGNGGQILLSESTHELIHDQLPAQIELLDLGKHRLKDLTRPEHIFQVNAPDLPSEFPPLKTVDYRPNNLPIPATPFIGRDGEITAIVEELGRPEVRLLTILGPGGMGKSRLAIEVGKNQLDDYSNGVYFISLAPLNSADNILSSIAEAVKFQFYPGMAPKQQILDYFREKQILLIMDNFEHLLAGVGLLTEIMTTAPDVKILATSRAKLNLRSETVYPLKGMSFPKDIPDAMTNDEVDLLGKNGHSALKLFVQSAQRARPDFDLHPENLANVTAICAQVDGLPLGIELAAAWVAMLSTSEIISEIKQGIDFLETEVRDIPERHHSIRAVLDHTWKMVGEKEQEVFKKLAVFRGGFAREAAQQVAEASLPLLLSLANKSLIRRDRTGRYQIHELLWQYAEEKLNEVPDVKINTHNRHCEYFSDLLHQNEESIAFGEQADFLHEMDNIRVSWRWGIKEKQFNAIRRSLVSRFWIFEVQNWYDEGRNTCNWAKEFLLNGEQHDDRVIVFWLIHAFCGWFSNNNEPFLESLRQLSKFEARWEVAVVSVMILFRGPRQSLQYSRQLFQEGVAIGEELRLPWVVAIFHQSFGLTLLYGFGAFFEAQHHLNEALKLDKNIKNFRGMAVDYRILGDIAFRQGCYNRAKEYFSKSSDLLDVIENVALDFGVILLRFGDIANIKCDYDEAKDRYQDALDIFKDMGDQWVYEPVRRLGDVAIDMGEIDEAIEYYRYLLNSAQNENTLSWEGIALIGHGKIQSKLGKFMEAQVYYLKALKIGKKLPSSTLNAYLLANLSEHLAQLGYEVFVVEISSILVTSPHLEQLEKEKTKKLCAAMEHKLSPQVFEEAKARGHDRDLQSTIEDVLVIMEAVDTNP